MNTAQKLQRQPVLLAAVKAHAQANSAKGWDILGVCDDAEIVELIGWSETPESAIAKVAKALGLHVQAATAPARGRCTERVVFIDDRAVSMHYDCPLHVQYTERERYDLLPV